MQNEIQFKGKDKVNLIKKQSRRDTFRASVIITFCDLAQKKGKHF
ncbi:hypothetical protein J2S21_003754 [Peribacillus cavernae]|nr:hypothetical protein [Peribacillus cavernae]